MLDSYALAGAGLLAAFGASRSEAAWSTDPAANLPLCTASDYQSGARGVSDGAGGAIFCWSDSRNGTGELYAQRVSAGGDVLWTTDGVSLGTGAGDALGHVIVTDGAGGAIVAYQVAAGIFAQRLSPTGDLLWTAGGVPVCTLPFVPQSVTLASDGAGGAIAAWTDYRNGPESDLAQRLDPNGAPAVGTRRRAALHGSEGWFARSPSPTAGGAIVA
jgi:hypothetical protein